MAKNTKSVKQNRAARERVAAMRAQQQRKQRRRLQMIIAVIAVVVIAGVGLSIQLGRTSVDDAATPAGVTEAGGGIQAPGTPAEGAPLVEVYEDFQCPHCKEFEGAVGPTLEQLASTGEARVVYRPVAFLGEDSVRAQAAAGCAADAGDFLGYHNVLFAVQGQGFSTDQLVAYGEEAGLTSSAFQQCVRDQTYEEWATASTQDFTARGVSGTPAVYINGELWQPAEYTPDGLLAAIADAR